MRIMLQYTEIKSSAGPCYTSCSCLLPFSPNGGGAESDAGNESNLHGNWTRPRETSGTSDTFADCVGMAMATATSRCDWGVAVRGAGDCADRRDLEERTPIRAMRLRSRVGAGEEGSATGSSSVMTFAEIGTMLAHELSRVPLLEAYISHKSGRLPKGLRLRRCRLWRGSGSSGRLHPGGSLPAKRRPK